VWGGIELDFFRGNGPKWGRVVSKFPHQLENGRKDVVRCHWLGLDPGRDRPGPVHQACDEPDEQGRGGGAWKRRSSDWKGRGGEGEGTPNHGSGHELTELGAGENAPGSRTPPSHTEPLPSRNGPALPPLSAWLVQGPLSLVKKTMVLSATPADSTAPSTSPTSQSSSATMSPNSPRLLTPQNLGDAKFGVWTCYHGNVMGWGWGRGVASERAGASK